MTPSPARSPSPPHPAASPPLPPRTPPPTVVAPDAYPRALEDGMAELHRERDSLIALPTYPRPFAPAHFVRVGLLEAESLWLRTRARELEEAQPASVSAPEEDPDVTIPAPAPLLPPIDLRPSVAPRLSVPPRAQDAREQRLTQLAAELAHTQDGVAERERAMAELRAEIACLRSGGT